MGVNKEYPLLCDIHRPWGAAAATYTDIPCALWSIALMDEGNLTASSIRPTHALRLPATVDINDGSTNVGGSASQTYSAGSADEVRVGPVRYAVVWVDLYGRELHQRARYKIALLSRGVVNWTSHAAEETP